MFYIIGPENEIVWSNGFYTRAEAEEWRELWSDWGSDCHVIAT